MKLNNLLFDNMVIKLLSLIFAITLWFYVASKGKMEVNLVAPLELKNIPASLITSGEVIDQVDITLSGKQILLRRLDQGQINASLDLSYALPGENTFYLTPENFNLPSVIDIVRIDPKVVKIRLEPRAFRPEGDLYRKDSDKLR